MYAPKIIEQNLGVANDLLRKELGDPKFYLERHTVDQVADATEIIKRAKVKFGSYDNLPNKLRRFILNEKTLCKLDFMYWATRYAYIKDFRKRVRRYEPNRAQLIVHDVYAETEEKGVEILVLWLKARRLGISTDSELRIQHRLQFYSYVTGIVGSSDPTNTDKMHKMMSFSWDRQPPWLKTYDASGKDIPRFKTGLFYEYANGSYLSLEHGTQFTDIGRGSDPSLFHLSECADYDRPEELIDSGLMRAVIPDAGNFGVLESTADGDEGWWHDSYWHDKENYPKGARFQAKFLPWFVGRDIYPTDAELRRNPVPDNWQPPDEVVRHAKAAKVYVDSTPYIKRHLGSDWQMPIEQMWFYLTNKQEYKDKKILHEWHSQMPASDREAFSTGRKSIFDAELLEKYRNACRPPLVAYMIRGKSIPEKYWPSEKEIDTKRRVIRVRADWVHTLPPFDFEFVPVKFDSESSPIGKLLLWEWPANGNTYAMPADTSDGLGEGQSDNSCIEMIRKGDRDRNDAQVAEFVSPEISGTALWPWTLAIGTFFSVVRDNKVRQPKLVPETNREGGRNLLRFMQERGWKEVHEERRRSSTRRGSVQVQYGLNLNPVNRQNILEWFKMAVEGEYLEINSQWLVSEMGTFIKHDDGKWAGAKGKKDDRVLSTAEGYWSMYDREARSTEPSPTIERPKVVSESERYPGYYEDDVARASEMAKLIRAASPRR
jgi:hypothetical protein